MRIFLSAILCFALVCPAVAQSFRATVKGVVVDESGVGVSYCYIKVTGYKNGQIYAYFNTGKSAAFETVVLLADSDSLLVTASHTGYSSAVAGRLVTPAQTQVSFRLVLRYPTKLMDSVTIKGPPVWRRGDTTFFRADVFKEGEERKLKELVVKIPGFELTEEGRLLYRKRPVEKITIDGEELFADKQQLLLNNFPVHVIHTIQAVENQSNEKLLKGLTAEKRTFLNLGLNKAKLKAAFGDGEAGLGAIGNYSFSPVIFSLYGKAKAGFIGNWNSIGKGTSPADRYEWTASAGNEGSRWQMQDAGLRFINNFESRWYIRNQQWDNRFQLNIPVGRNGKSSTQLNFLTDKQSQESFYLSSVYGDSAFFLRQESNDLQNRPFLVQARQEFVFAVDSAKQMKLSAAFFGDFSRNDQLSAVSQQGITTGLTNQVKTNGQSGELKADYLNRVSATQAVKWSLTASRNTLRQGGQTLSPEAGFLFDNNSYNSLGEKTTIVVSRLELAWDKMIKQKVGLLNFGLQAWRHNVETNNDVRISSNNTLEPVLSPPIFNNQQDFTATGLRTYLKKNLPFWGKESLSVNAEAGVVRSQTHTAKPGNGFTTPVYKLSVGHKAEIFRKFFQGEAILSYTQSENDLYRQRQLYFPHSLTAFQRYANVSLPSRSLHLNYNLAWQWPGNAASSGYLGVFVNRYFTSNVFISHFSGFLQTSTDSLLAKPTQSFFIYTSHDIPSLFFNALFNFDLSYNRSNRFMANGNSLVETQLSYTTFTFSFKKNWNKKYYIQLSNSLTRTRFNLPEYVKGSLSPVVTKNISFFRQRLMLNKQITIIGMVSLINNNAFSASAASFLFADMECTFKPKNRRLSFSLKADNLTNQRNYYSVLNSGISQSFYTVPLVQRNLFAAVRYEF